MASISRIKIPGIESAFDIDAVKVTGHTVAKDVPSDAIFSYVFNTAYDPSLNKAASMADISAAIGDAIEASY